MNAASRRFSIPLRVVPSKSKLAVAADELKIARCRMRHLASWHIEPLPRMHSVGGTPEKSLTPAQRERSERLALQVLAVQMWQAATRSALQ